MEALEIFKDINKSDIDLLLKCLHARKQVFKKDRTIYSSMYDIEMIGVILSGTASIVKFDYYGNRTLIDQLTYNDVFGKSFTSIVNDVSIVADTDCEILIIDYPLILERCRKNCPCHAKLTDNILNLLSKKIENLNVRIDLLSKRTTRDKLLSYFDLMTKSKIKKEFILPFTYTDLADFLSVDRSAMTREIKYLKDEGFIETKGKKITILY